MKREKKNKQYPGVGVTNMDTFSTDPEVLRKRKWKKVFTLIFLRAGFALIGVAILVVGLLLQ